MAQWKPYQPILSTLVEMMAPEETAEDIVARLIAGSRAAHAAVGALPHPAVLGKAQFYGGGAPVYTQQTGDTVFDPFLVTYLHNNGWVRTHEKAGVEAANLARHALVQSLGSFDQGTSIWPSAEYDFGPLAASRGDVAALGRFALGVDYATFHLCAAIDAADGPDVWPKASKPNIRRAPKSWLGRIAAATFTRWGHVRTLLVHQWTPPEPVVPLYRCAFQSLSKLTPADNQLRHLFELDSVAACRELARHVDIVAEQLKLTCQLSDAIEQKSTSEGDASAQTAEGASLASLQAAILAKAGERLTLTDAAKRLDVSRQALHKRIKSGSALGVMVGGQLIVPSAQFVKGADGCEIVAGLKRVLAHFAVSGAGDWSALQFLVEPDPMLGGIPLDHLKDGQVRAVSAAARAYLGLDEG